jgi:general secretion pathway protein A
MRTTLRLSIHQSFAHRLAIRYPLGPFDLAATLANIRHQPQVAGHNGPSLFTDEAMSRIYDYTKGLPRQINRVCSMVLTAAV